MRIAYLFTTFPVLSETFLQREISAMRELPVQIEIYSLHGGQDSFEGLPVKRFRKWELIKLLWLLPLRVLENPRAVHRMIEPLFVRRMPSCQNLWETLLGIAFAIIHVGHFRRVKPDLFHAVWATMPASAAMLLREYTGIPYSMGAHAYDVFRNGGDWLLPEKLNTARLIHTTTEATKQALLARGAQASKIVVIRRGLHVFPEMKHLAKVANPMRIVSVGRLVEKKGYEEQLLIYRFLKDHGFAFEARIVGTGLIEKKLAKLITRYGLEGQVLLLGKRDYSGVLEQLDWADVMLFTGRVTTNGDRDGLPNVIPEAMAAGVPVVSTPVAGVPEAIAHGKTGLLVRLDDTQGWMDALVRLRDDAQLRANLRMHARAWVEEFFCARRNAATLAEHLRASANLPSGVRRNPLLAESQPLRHRG